MRATYRGHCDLCDDAITPGDDIRRASHEDDSWQHVDCIARLEADVDRVLSQMGLERKRCPVCADTLQGGVCTNCER